MRQSLHQFILTTPGQKRWCEGTRRLGNKSVDSLSIRPAKEDVSVSVEIDVNKYGMLNCMTIVVDDIQGPVRAIGREHRLKPTISRLDKFILVLRSDCRKGGASGNQAISMDHAVNRFTDQIDLIVGIREKASGVNSLTTRGSKMSKLITMERNLAHRNSGIGRTGIAMIRD